MEDNIQEAGGKWRVWLVGIILILVFGAGMFLFGKFIAAIGRNSASQVADVINSPTPLTPTETSAPPTLTLQPVTPSPTETPFWIVPTITQTIIPWSVCPGIVISASDTPSGDMLHVLRCSDGFEYDLGPLSKGVYAVAPDDKYLVYCSLDGILYAARIGDTFLSVIKNLRKDGEFTVFPKKINPLFRLTFTGNVLEIYETKYGQNMPVKMPGWLSQ